MNHINEINSEGFAIIDNVYSENEIEKIISEQISEVRLPPNLPKEIYENLPDETGVYYMHNQAGEVIYVGKSNEIKTRIRSHCQDAHNKVRGLKMMEEIYDISYL